MVAFPFSTIVSKAGQSNGVWFSGGALAAKAGRHYPNRTIAVGLGSGSASKCRARGVNLGLLLRDGRGGSNDVVRR